MSRHCSDSLVKHLIQALPRERRALKVLDRTNLFRHLEPLCGGQLPVVLAILVLDAITQVELCAHQEEGHVGKEVAHLLTPRVGGVGVKGKMKG